MLGRLEGKACLVTGCASGIGAAIAARFASEGGRVVCVDCDGDNLVRQVEKITADGGEALACVADVSERSDVDDAVDRCVKTFGSIDVLVNNAGINIPGVFHEVDDATIDRTLGVNLKGPIYACQAAIPHMLGHGRGSIVNISSVNGVVAEPLLTIYAASKGGMVMLSRGIALDYAKRGIRCNVICPGWVDTPINYPHAEMMGGLETVYATIDSFQPIGRPGTPEEIANVALFLASDEASFMTGSVVLADGGMTAH
ncbi:MAG: SDR family oxidoreductase [Acidobacteriota bacterium]|nr:SDR family oxidoreductase [Acidobacteriota bacterium]